MDMNIRQLHPFFVGEITGIDLCHPLTAETVDAIDRAMQKYAVLVFHDQHFTDDQQVAFAESLGEVDTVVRKYMTRLSDKLSDISNLMPDGSVRPVDDSLRLYTIANRLWHSDSTFRELGAKYSMLSAREIPATGGDTQFADERAAFAALSPEAQAEALQLNVVHVSYQSRRMLNFYDKFPEDDWPPKVNPLVRVAADGRPTLYLASHASHIEGWPVAEGRMLLLDLIEHATQTQFVYTHKWKVGDFVIWDNRCTLHRARRTNPNERRDLRRTTIRDVPRATHATRPISDNSAVDASVSA